jgi:anti-sigma factor RsiW
VGDVLHLRDEHEQAQMLLPWRVNGTLEPDEAAQFDAHLAGCKECRADLAANLAMRRIYAATPAEGISERPVLLPVGNNGSPFWDVGRRLSSGWGRAASAAMAAAAAIVLVVVLVPSAPEGEYRLLGSDSRARPGNAIVLFSPDTPARDMRAALEGAEVKLVDGPTASGAYIVRVPETGRGAALEHLRSLPWVVLAEPIDAADGS